MEIRIVNHVWNSILFSVQVLGIEIPMFFQRISPPHPTPLRTSTLSSAFSLLYFPFENKCSSISSSILSLLETHATSPPSNCTLGHATCQQPSFTCHPSPLQRFDAVGTVYPRSDILQQHTSGCHHTQSSSFPPPLSLLLFPSSFPSPPSLLLSPSSSVPPPSLHGS